MNTMDEPKVAFWNYANIDRRHKGYITTIKELMEDLYNMFGDNLPETIEIVGYAPVKIDIDEMADWAIGSLLFKLDEKYASEEDYSPPTLPTVKMKNAAKEFVEKVAKEYDVDVYEEVCRKTVHPKDYLKDKE